MWSIANLNSESNYHNKAKEPSISYYLPISRGIRYGFMLFSKALAQRWIWTWFIESIHYENNCYTIHSSLPDILGHQDIQQVKCLKLL